jgi:hypothetical protein
MRLALSPGDRGLRSLRCEQCDRLDPLKADDVIGWLEGELRPPKQTLIPGSPAGCAAFRIRPGICATFKY